MLFDEIEKGHPDVFNVLLQILDDGRLTDSQGRLVDFRNTVIIMTSNIGSQYIVDAGAQLDPRGWEKVEQRVRDELRNHFRPEFLNRVDDIIVFRQLSREDLVQIVDLQLEKLVKMLEDRHIHLEVTPQAKALIAAEGYDPVYGARPLKRVIQRLLQNPDRAGAAGGQLPRGRHHSGGAGWRRAALREGRTGRGARCQRWPVRRGTPSPSDLAGMEAALRLARAASVREEVPVGAVIIAEGEILGEAHNETVQRRDPTAHAELLAIHRALQKVGEDRLPMATLYVTLEPCAQCAGADRAGQGRPGGVRRVRCEMRNGGLGVRPASQSETESPAGGRGRAHGRGVRRSSQALFSEQAVNHECAAAEARSVRRTST